jgi:hypothetical protein
MKAIAKDFEESLITLINRPFKESGLDPKEKAREEFSCLQKRRIYTSWNQYQRNFSKIYEEFGASHDPNNPTKELQR